MRTATDTLESISELRLKIKTEQTDDVILVALFPIRFICDQQRSESLTVIK
jgi:hypothetical protein